MWDLATLGECIVLDGAYADTGMNECTVNLSLTDRKEVNNELLPDPKVGFIGGLELILVIRDQQN